MRALLDTCIAVTASDAALHWISDHALLAEGVRQWTELPLRIPESEPSFGGFMLGDNREWDLAEGVQPTERPIRAIPLTSQRETEILARAQ